MCVIFNLFSSQGSNQVARFIVDVNGPCHEFLEASLVGEIDFYLNGFWVIVGYPAFLAICQVLYTCDLNTYPGYGAGPTATLPPFTAEPKTPLSWIDPAPTLAPGNIILPLANDTRLDCHQ